MLLCLDYESDVPIYLQIRNQIVIGIANGELENGEKLPTIRSLSNDLGINMMTVSKAYQLLKSEGYLVGDRRNGAIINIPEPSNKDTKLSDQAMNDLKIIASEAKLVGMSLGDFVNLCKTTYNDTDSMEVEQ